LFTGAKFTSTSLLDLTNPDANQWAADKMRGLIDLGSDGWMHDYAEWLPTDAVMHGGDSIKFHNRYPVLWQQIARGVIDEKKDDRQRTFFVRSGWFGTPQIADVFWAGDQSTNFAKDDGMPSVITQGINLSVNGCPAYGHDISGYQSSLGTPATKELFWRWTALGAFSPVMRTHHGYQDALNHNLTTDPDTTDMWRRYAIEHVQLAPYLMAQAKKASEETGLALFRGLFLQYPDEDTSWTIRDEFLLGDAILVAPVIEKDATSRKVWFPTETHWFPWTGGAAKEIVSADRTEEIAAPLGEIPVFVRPGTVIPRYPDTIRTLVYSSTEVPGPAQVGDDRDVLVFVGGAYSITEPGDLGYELTIEQGSASVDPKYSWNGAALPICPTTGVPQGCVTADTGIGAIAYVTGPGDLRIEASGQASVVKIKGGKSTRQLSIQVRR
jgi:alpha-glucosidase (family GH31 glycosyl hydrolase)